MNFETIKQLVDTTTKEKGIYGRCELNTIDEKEAKAIKEATNCFCKSSVANYS